MLDAIQRKMGIDDDDASDLMGQGPLGGRHSTD